MNSKKFHTNIIIRVILITLTVYLASAVTGIHNYLYTLVSLVFLSALQTYLLINYIIKQRKLMSRMLSYIRDHNPTIYFSQGHDTPFRELGDFLNEIGDIVRDVRIEKESQLQYMNHISSTVPVGLLAFDQYGTIELFNPECRRITGIRSITSVNDIEKVIPGFLKHVNNRTKSEPGVLNFMYNKRMVRLSVKSSFFTSGTGEMTVVSLQDIGAELDEKEVEAWQKLIRILTHEIINSVTPITSLSSALSALMPAIESGNLELTGKQAEKIVTGLGYIEERGKGLIDFVNRYRSLTRIPEPDITEVNLHELIEKIIKLKEKEAEDRGVSIRVNVLSKEVTVACDQTLTEHVIINIVNNALESYEGLEDNRKREVEITIVDENHATKQVCVRDFGRGIDETISGDIFIPFFTTRQNGSGIGLSLSRQIMNKQGGSISYSPVKDKGALFIIRFNGSISMTAGR